MRPPFAPSSPAALPAGCGDSSREGRDCELSHRLTRLVFFPRLDAIPGPWLMFLAAMCSFVAVRVLEQRHLWF